MLVCYDKTFPEAARQLALDGAGLIASLSAWPVCRVDPATWLRRDLQVRHFNLLDQTRALENQVVWVSSNQVGRFGRLRFAGPGEGRRPARPRAREDRRAGGRGARARRRAAASSRPRATASPTSTIAARTPTRPSGCPPDVRDRRRLRRARRRARPSRCSSCSSHRGPDDEGEVRVDGAWLGHRRLSIVDVDGGHQPFANAAGDVWLVGNGEVYNHEQVRAHARAGAVRDALGQRGRAAPARRARARRRSTSSRACSRSSSPATTGASSPPATRSGSSRCTGRAATAGCASRRRSRRSRRTGCRTSRRFPPGCHWTPERRPRALRQRRAAGRRGRAGRARGVERRRRAADRGARARRARILVASVRRQMMGDVPVGVFLSGGLDSAIVAAIAARHARRATASG